MKATLVLDNHKVISWNDFYSTPHWAVRKHLADEVHQLVKFEALGQEVPHFDKPVKITITAGKVRYPVDSDNISKLYVDGLVHAGVIDDDDYKHVLQVTTGSEKANTDFVDITISDED